MSDLSDAPDEINITLNRHKIMCGAYVLTIVKVVVKKQNVLITCSGIVGPPPTMQRICSPM